MPRPPPEKPVGVAGVVVAGVHGDLAVDDKAQFLSYGAGQGRRALRRPGHAFSNLLSRITWVHERHRAEAGATPMLLKLTPRVSPDIHLVVNPVCRVERVGELPVEGDGEGGPCEPGVEN